MMIHHIVFSDCVDGVVSAAMYLSNKVENDLYRLYPLSKSIIKEDRLNNIIQEMKLKDDTDLLILLNCNNHHRSDLWASCNFSGQLGMDKIINRKIIYDPNSLSTSRVINDVCKIVDDFSSFLNEIAMINKSSYKHVRQIFLDTRPTMLLRAYIERTMHSDMMMCRIVEMISKCNFDFKKALYQLKITRRVIKDLQSDAQRTLRDMVTSGNISILRQNRIDQYYKYSEFYANLNVKYSVRLTNISHDRVWFEITYNKWCGSSNEIDISQIISSCGIKMVAGAEYNYGKGMILSKDCENFLDIISDKLNKGDDMEEEMEKYGVDKSDSIEKEAENMVKSGEAENISDAREKASESGK